MGSTPVKLKDDRCLLLVGDAGVGKSSTGNTILGKKVFYTEGSSKAVTLNATVARGIFDGYTLKVIDTAAVRDLRVSAKEQQKRAVLNFTDGFLQCPNGFHAVLMVVKYGSRFKTNELQVIDLLKEMFGPNILMKHGIVVVTRGDELFRHKEKYAKLSDWLEKQEGGLIHLIRECDQRVILFSNSNSAKEQESRDRLFEYLNPMTEMFTKDMFQANQ